MPAVRAPAERQINLTKHFGGIAGHHCRDSIQIGRAVIAGKALMRVAKNNGVDPLNRMGKPHTKVFRVVRVARAQPAMAQEHDDVGPFRLYRSNSAPRSSDAVDKRNHPRQVAVVPDCRLRRQNRGHTDFDGARLPI